MDIGQTKAATRRYRESDTDREANAKLRKMSDLPVLDTEEQLRTRAMHVVESSDLPARKLLRDLDSRAAGTSIDRSMLYERIIAEVNDLQPVAFLTGGCRAAETVGRIGRRVRGRVVAAGTGFLVGRRLMLTNNHVLPDLEAAQGAVLEFGVEADSDGQPRPVRQFDLDPETMFRTDAHLDYTMVAVAPGPDGKYAGDDAGWTRMIASQGKIVTGEPVNIIGHPSGRPKEIAIRNNELQHQHDDFLQYATDTEPGNSGSPVFNDQWELVALHHSGVPKTDEQGRWLRTDGQVWREGDGEDAIDWVGNEGARVSVLLRHLFGQLGDQAAQAVLDELGPQARPPAPAPSPPAASGQATPIGVSGDGSVSTAGAARLQSARPVAGADSSAATVASDEAAARTRGVRARSGAINGTGVVLIHGRSQEGRDPAALRRDWVGGLNRGLTLAGLATCEPTDVTFPFYGDVLIDRLDSNEMLRLPDGVLTPGGLVTPAEAMAPVEPSTHDLYADLLTEAALLTGYPRELVDAGAPPAETPATEEGLLDRVAGSLQGRLGWIANRTGLDQVLIARLFRDVAAYLDRDQVRQAVLDCVLTDLPKKGKVILVAHSLGSVVALDLVDLLPSEVEVVQLITVGSPLGMDGVSGRLRSVRRDGRRDLKRPARVVRWLNAYAPVDPVAIGCPLSRTWTGGIDEVVTSNARERAHDVSEYLADPRVARAVLGSITRATDSALIVPPGPRSAPDQAPTPA